MKRKRAGPPPSWRKRQHRSEFGADSEAEDMIVEDIDTPLTRGDIPTIVIAVLRNLTTEDTDDTPDNTPLDEFIDCYMKQCSALLATL